jgi:serine/threonine-protein kinase ATR
MHQPDSEDDWVQTVDVELGAVRSLIELGHFQLVLHQVSGIASMTPEYEHVLLPAAVQAAWRLQRWTEVDSLVTRYEQLEEDALRGARSGFTESFAEDRYHVGIGKLLLCLHASNESALVTTLAQMRQRLMPQLAAASMESYQRAYPQLVKLHILREIEQAHELVTARAATLSPHEDKTALLGKKDLRIVVWNITRCMCLFVMTHALR